MSSCFDSFDRMYDRALATLFGFFDSRGSSTDPIVIAALPASPTISDTIREVEMERARSFDDAMKEASDIMAMYNSYLALPLEERAKIAAIRIIAASAPDL